MKRFVKLALIFSAITMMLTSCFFGGGSTASYSPSIYGQWRFADGKCFEITQHGFYRDFAQTKGVWVISNKDIFNIVSGSSHGGTFRIGNRKYRFTYVNGQWDIQDLQSGAVAHATRVPHEITPVGLVGRWSSTDGLGSWRETYTADGHYQMLSSEVTNPAIDEYRIISGDLNNGIFVLYDSKFEFDVTGLTLTVKRLDDDYAWKGSFMF